MATHSFEENDDDIVFSEEDDEVDVVEEVVNNNKVDLAEQRKLLEAQMKNRNIATEQDIKNINFGSSDDEEQTKPSILKLVDNNLDEISPKPTINVDKILQDYQSLSKFEEEELIQQKSTATKRSIHPNKIFSLSITSVCTLLGISCGFIISHFTLYSVGFISVIILFSILLIGLALWFGSTEVIEEKVTVTQARMPVTNMLSKKAINLWRSAECQTLSQPQENTIVKSYVNEETRNRFADKDDDEQFDTEIDITSRLLAKENNNDFDESDFSDDFSENSLDEQNDINIHSQSNKTQENLHSSAKQQKAKLEFIDIDQNPNTLHPKKVKRCGEKDHIIYGPFIPSFITGKWTCSKSDDFENFEEKWKNLSNIVLRDDLVGQRNSIVPNIRMKNEDDYRSSRIFTEIEMGNIKNNVNQHREELFNFGVDNTNYEPVIAPPKVKDLCKIRKLVLKFE